MSKNLFGISTLIMSIAFLIWSIGETFAYPQGPNVSLGSNPIVTIQCASGQSAISSYPNIDNPYVVPSGYDYIITDVGIYGNSTNTVINVNDGSGYKALYSAIGFSSGDRELGYSFNTGIKIMSGHSVYCYHSQTGFISGYLAHQ